MIEPSGDEPPRCPKCGDVPPIRKLDPDSHGRITYQCCGEVFVIRVEDLHEDTKLERRPDAA